MPIFNIQTKAQQKDAAGRTIDLPPQVGLLRQGPVIPVTVRLEANMAKPILAQGQAIMGQPGVALIDTGASISAIDEQIAKDLRIPVVDRGRMSSASRESTPCNLYPVEFTIGNTIVVQVPRAMGAVIRQKGFIAIIGRDILQSCTLIYNGPLGTVTLAM